MLAGVYWGGRTERDGESLPVCRIEIETSSEERLGEARFSAHGLQTILECRMLASTTRNDDTTLLTCQARQFVNATCSKLEGFSVGFFPCLVYRVFLQNDLPTLFIVLCYDQQGVLVAYTRSELDFLLAEEFEDLLLAPRSHGDLVLLLQHIVT